jgi:hypothetical protein
VHLIRETAAGKVIAELIGQAQLDPALKEALLASYTGPRRARAVERIERGQVAGQVRADLDAESLIDQLWGACYHRWLLPNQPLTDDFADELVRNLFAGVGGKPQRRRRFEDGVRNRRLRAAPVPLVGVILGARRAHNKLAHLASEPRASRCLVVSFPQVRRPRARQREARGTLPVSAFTSHADSCGGGSAVRFR